MSDKQYLVQRRQGWYVQVRVPDALYHLAHKRKIVRSLETRDLQEARERRWPVVAEIKAYLSALQKMQGTEADPDSPAGMVANAKAFKQKLDLRLVKEPEEAQESYLTGLDAMRFNYVYPMGSSGIAVDQERGARLEMDAEKLKAFELAERIVSGDAPLMASEALSAHLKEGMGHMRQQTINARRRRVKAFLKWLGGDKELTKITEEEAGDYVTYVISPDLRSVKTKRDEVADISTFFNWAKDRKKLKVNPFDGLSGTIKDKKSWDRERKETRRRVFTNEELRTVLSTIKDNYGTEDALWSLAVIAMFTGMRGNEICETRVEDVHDDYIHVPYGKTKASVRDVPLHPLLKPLVVKLKEESTDEYLISGLKRGGEDMKRYQNLGKRFMYMLRNKAKLTDPRLVEHCFRHTVSTALENAGVPHNVAEQIVGHEKKSMTFGHYSGGVDMKTLQEAICKLPYKLGDLL